jgi:hypothetical protein
LIIAGIAVLAACSVGCKTEVAPQAVIDPSAAAPAYTQTAPNGVAPPYSQDNQAPPYNQAADYVNNGGPGGDGYPSYATRRYVRTISPPPVVIDQRVDQRYSEPYADRGYGSRRVVVTRERPLSHSVAIVGGSAGVGAGIGAIAGGGKGAGIGALAGGGAGFIYDRLTHKRKVVVEERQ